MKYDLQAISLIIKYTCPTKKEEVEMSLNNLNLVEGSAIEVNCPICKQQHVFDGTEDDCHW